METSSAVTILTIDDHTDTNVMMQLLLKAYGYHVLTAETATKGLELAKKNRPRIVLLDLRLPDVDGLTFLQSLQSTPELASTRTIAISGYVPEESSQKALAAGFDAYFAKPLDFDHLLRTIARLLALSS